jgi:methylmalonyl-CoA mutase N-terminal domain/subunit
MAQKKSTERKTRFKTHSDIRIEPYYLPPQQGPENYSQKLGEPGHFPFTRGVQPTMYRGRLWTMRQYAGFGTAQQSNDRYKKLISSGSTGLSVAFDLPTQMGLDSDDPRALGEVGKTGVAIDTLADMETLFEGIDLTAVSTSMTINATAIIILAMHIALAQKKGIDPKCLKGTIQNDILKEYVARGTQIFPVTPSMRLVTDTFAFCKDHLPQFNTISISGYHIREAGSTATQELAFTLANGLAYVNAALKAGLCVDAFAPRLSFFFNAHNNFFEEVAKFRSARRLWATLMKKHFNANDRSCQLRFHTQTGGSTLTAQQPDNNIVRVAYQALSAVLGGTQSLHTNSRDEALALPTEESVNIALCTQHILAEETGVPDTIDPLAGSYFVEHLTDEMEKRALEYLKKIDTLGGAVAAIEQGYIQNQIQQAAYEYQKSIESKEQIIVGINAFQNKKPIMPKTFKLDNNTVSQQKKSLAKIKKQRDQQTITKHLSIIKNKAQSKDNLLPALIEAVTDYVSLGEITSVLKDVFGVYSDK